MLAALQHWPPAPGAPAARSANPGPWAMGRVEIRALGIFPGPNPEPLAPQTAPRRSLQKYHRPGRREGCRGSRGWDVSFSSTRCHPSFRPHASPAGPWETGEGPAQEARPVLRSQLGGWGELPQPPAVPASELPCLQTRELIPEGDTPITGTGWFVYRP